MYVQYQTKRSLREGYSYQSTAHDRFVFLCQSFWEAYFLKGNHVFIHILDEIFLYSQGNIYKNLIAVLILKN